jgi:DNA replication protein DnaC
MENIRQSQQANCPDCGGPAASYRIGTNRIYRQYCGACEHRREQEERNRKAKEQAEFEQRWLAAMQRAHDEEITRRLDAAIPRRFAGAELEHIPGDLVDKFEALADGQGMFLFGPAGCGKSYAMAAFAKKYIRDGIWPVVMINWERFLCGLRASFGSEPGRADRAIQSAMGAAVLFIDDAMLTGGQESDFSLRTLYSIIDHRAEACLTTFFSANRQPDDLSAAYDERIKSRVLGYSEVVRLQGRDRRLPK